MRGGWAKVRGAPAGPWAGLGWPGLRGRLGCKALFSLSKENKKQNRDRKEKKEGLGEEVGHGDNFSGLAKMSLFREK